MINEVFARRAERERVESREKHGNSDGYRELLIQPSGYARYEGGGQKDGGEHQGNSHDRAADLLDCFQRSSLGRHAFLDMPLHRLNHHNGIVYNQANREHQAKERKRVHGKTEDGENREGADQSGVRVAVLRLPPSVHGAGDHGFVPFLIGIARKKGVSAYIGDGVNCWPAVHRLDASRLYRLALEKGSVGANYHGVADEGIPTRDIAHAIGRRLNVPVVSKSPEEAAGHFGWMAHFFGIDGPASSAQTQQQLGWHPTQPGLVADLEEYYFQSEPAA
jgi:hypothetical protein